MKITVTQVTTKRQGVNKKNQPWTISELTTSDGKKYDTFDTFTHGEFDVEIIAATKPGYNDTVKKPKGQSQYQSNTQAAAVAQIHSNADDKDQRISMLSCLSTAAVFYQQRQGTEQQVIDFAKKLFHEAMTHKFNELPF